MLTQRNMVANTLQAAAWARPFFAADAGVVVTPLPLYHVYSLTANLLCFVELGGHNLLITDPRDMQGVRRAAAQDAVRVHDRRQHAVQRAAARAGLRRRSIFPSLRVCMGGGMAVQREVATRWQAVTGVPIAQGYGLTEASPIVTGNPLHLKEFNGSVGVPFPSTEVAIFDDDGRRARRRRGRRDLRARPAGDGRLLAAARRDGAGHVRRRLAAHGRRRAARRGRLSCSSRIGRRTSSSSRGSRCIRTRSRTSRRASPACAKRPRSASPTRSRARS